MSCRISVVKSYWMVNITTVYWNQEIDNMSCLMGQTVFSKFWWIFSSVQEVRCFGLDFYILGFDDQRDCTITCKAGEAILTENMCSPSMVSLRSFNTAATWWFCVMTCMREQYKQYVETDSRFLCTYTHTSSYRMQALISVITIRCRNRSTDEVSNWNMVQYTPMKLSTLDSNTLKYIARHY